jgi:hypothetical protein
VFRDIFWKRGRIAPDEFLRPVPAPPPGWLQTPLSAEEHQQIAATIAPLADAELRQGLEQILIRQRQLRRHQEDLAKKSS